MMTPDDDAPLVFRLLGPFDVRVRGAPLPKMRSRTGQWLLALLVLNRDRYLDREWLADTLWPESEDRSTSRTSLRTYLSDLRRALGPEAHRLYAPTQRTLSLDLSGVDVDLITFDAAIARGDVPSLERAVSLYRGPLLDGCAQDWVLLARDSRERACVQALETLAEDAEEREEIGAAERYARRATALDPLRERAYRTLMRALAAGGNYAAAREVYQQLLRLLGQPEHRSDPAPETRALYRQIRAEVRRKAERAADASHGARAATEPAESGRRVASLWLPAPTSPVATPPPPRPLPQGTVTFLFTDIEGSTRLWEEHPEAMRAALLRHDAILRAAIEGEGGHVFKTMGDAFCAAFATAPEALATALAAQRALHAEAWPENGALRVRMALYTGVVEERGGDYFGPPLNRVSRLLALAHGGQILVSSATQDLGRDRLPEGALLRDLGLHRLQDVPRPEPVYQLHSADLPTDFPPLRGAVATPNNLPRDVTSFVGRDAEIAEVTELLGGAALLTLTGAGGCGKTRLALEVAGTLLADYPDGVWFVELAALTDPSLVPQTVAGALGVREEPGRSLTETLLAFLQSRKALLLLDNCEHLIDACAGLAETLLKGCPDLRIMATSRHTLGAAGELLYRVPSLSVPTSQPRTENRQLTTALQSEAVRLFAERAAFSDPRFAVTERNAGAVAQVCRQLDGIPLAIELAAARVKAFTVEEIAARLGDRFRLLTGGLRTALPRQQTLRASIDWSYDLLTEKERTLLRRLAVFAGGWTIEAAEDVCSDDGIEASEILDLLLQLVEKSLVLREAREGATRYRLLETIREYGAEKLRDAEGAEALRERHGNWFLALAERAEPELTGPAQGEWLSRLDVEHDNLRAALDGMIVRDDAELALRLATALRRFWAVRGYLGDGRERLGKTLELRRAGTRTKARARALTGMGILAHLQGDYEAARLLHEESLAIVRDLGDREGIAVSIDNLALVARQHGDYPLARLLHEESLAIKRELGDKRGVATSLNNLGLLVEEQGDYAAARVFHEESLAIYRGLGGTHGIAVTLNNLGNVAHSQGDYGTARPLYEECLAIVRELGDKQGIAISLNNLGNVVLDQGDYDSARVLHQQSLEIVREMGDKSSVANSLGNLGLVAKEQADYAAARVLYEESLAIRRQLGDRRMIATTLCNLGYVALACRSYPETRNLHRESLTIRRELGDRYGITDSLEGIARLAGALGQPEYAARLFAAAAAVREAIGAPLPPREHDEVEGDVAVARESLGEAAFAAAWAAGQAMTMEEAVALALADLEEG